MAENCTDEAKKKELREQADEKLLKAKRKSLGNIRFIGELFKLNMLTESIMFDCIERLLKQESDEENIECLCILLTTIGKELDKSNNQCKIKLIFDRLDGIVLQKSAGSVRVHGMIINLIQLRERQWNPESQKKPESVTSPSRSTTTAAAKKPTEAIQLNQRRPYH